ncbi:thioredoxin family protein [Planctomycetota bacterium]|nr:thioredoxin family protein [Planctomycetota bacterium]
MAITPSTMLPLGTVAPEFALPDTVSGKVITRSSFDGTPLLVLFICNHCPFVKHLRGHFGPFFRDAMKRGLAVVAISANDVAEYPEDAPALMTREAAAAGWPFPYLYDESQAVARAYRAACTPDFFLFGKDHRLAYRGRYDATRPARAGQAGSAPTGSDLGSAIADVLAGRPVAIEQKPSMGCNIKWKPGNEPA